MKLKIKNLNRGFTLIELLVTIAILAIILAGSATSYLNWQRSQNLNQYSDQILSLVYQAQNQAMSRMCTQNCDLATTGENFGVYFDATNRKTILFRGLVYNPADIYNIPVNFPDTLSLSTDLPNSVVIFEKVTGEIRSFDADNNDFSLTESTSGNSKSFSFNRLGVADTN